MLRLQRAEQQLEHTGLACAAGPHQCGELPRMQMQTHVLQHWLATVAEGDVFHLYKWLHLISFLVLMLRRYVRCIEVFDETGITTQRIGHGDHVFDHHANVGMVVVPGVAR